MDVHDPLSIFSEFYFLFKIKDMSFEMPIFNCLGLFRSPIPSPH